VNIRCARIARLALLTLTLACVAGSRTSSGIHPDQTDRAQQTRPTRRLRLPAEVYEKYDAQARLLRVRSHRDGQTHAIHIPAHFELSGMEKGTVVESQFYFVVNGALHGPSTDPIQIDREKLKEIFTVKLRPARPERGPSLASCS
jgi:hypothetical protein